MAGDTIEELTRRAFGLWNDRDFDRLLEMFTEDTVWDTTPIGVPDMGKYLGHAGLRSFFADWLEAFPDSTIEVEAYETRGEWGMATVIQYVSGGSSGAPVPFRYYGIGHWTGGQLDFVENHIDERLATEAFHSFAKSQATSRLT